MQRFSEAAAANERSRQRRRPLGRYRYVRLRWRLLFSVIDFFGWSIVRFLRKLPCGRRARATHRSDPRAILLVQLDHLGDAVITTSLLPLLKARFPHATIDVLASRRNGELFAFCGEVDRVHVARVNRWNCAWPGLWMAATLWWGFRLRRFGYDMAIDVRGEFPHALILWLSGASRRIGFDSGGGGFLLTDSPSFVPGRQEIQSRRALAELLEMETIGDAPLPSFDPGPEARRRVGRLLADFESPARPLYVWHVGAGTPAKTWPAEHWRELLGRAIVEHDARVALVGGRQDVEAAQRVIGDEAWPSVIDCTGRLSLAETAALAERADVFVGSDSGPAHLAAAVGTPVVVLFSGTNAATQWKPAGDHVRVLRRHVSCSPCHRKRCPWSDHPCMNGISPTQVMAAIESVSAWRRLEMPDDHALAGGNRRVSSGDTHFVFHGTARRT